MIFQRRIGNSLGKSCLAGRKPIWKDFAKNTLIGVIAIMSRSEMIFNIANLVNDGAISMDDLEEFSDDLKAAVRMFLRKG